MATSEHRDGGLLGEHERYIMRCMHPYLKSDPLYQTETPTYHLHIVIMKLSAVGLAGLLAMLDLASAMPTPGKGYPLTTA